MHDVLRFWLDRGVDGFRIDVVHLIGKDPALPDQPVELGQIDRVGVHDDPRTHACCATSGGCSTPTRATG